MNIHDTFRRVNRGDTEMEVNSAPQAASRFVDQSRLASHEVWEPSSDPKKPGRIVRQPRSIEENVRRSMGALKSRSVYKSDCDAEVGNFARGDW